MVREFWRETESVCERHDERQRQTDSNGCPVPKKGTGRYRPNRNSNVEGARLKRKSRRPLQRQNQTQIQRQRRLRKAGETPTGRQAGAANYFPPDCFPATPVPPPAPLLLADGVRPSNAACSWGVSVNM